MVLVLVLVLVVLLLLVLLLLVLVLLVLVVVFMDGALHELVNYKLNFPAMLVQCSTMLMYWRSNI